VDLSLGVLLSQMASYPSLGVILVLVILVTIVSGATDAPNAIASAVSTRCMKPVTALIAAAIFNFIGVMAIPLVSTAVAKTMFAMVDFSGDTHTALMALMAAMIGSIIWGVFCWFKGIPASKSHSLIAGITGGAIALNGWGGVVVGEWMMVIYGMLFSLFAGFAIGWLVVRLFEKLFRYVNRRKGNQTCIVVQNILACALAFLHGAQDGSKFLSIGVLGIALSFGMEDAGSTGFPLWLMITCSIAMSIGTIIGGKRIIKSVAMDMVRLEKYQGVAASISTATTLFVSNLVGMPVSTSHCNTSAIMSVGASKNPRDVKWNIAGNMVLAWVLTFPCCGLIGFVLAKLFMLL